MSNPLANISGAARPAHPFSVADHELAGQTIAAAMKATKTARSRDPKTGLIVYVEVPDWTIRLPAAVKVVEFVAGKPISMTLTADLTPGQAPTSQDDFLRNVLRDKDAVHAIQDVLRKMVDAEAKTQAIDVTNSEPAPSPPSTGRVSTD